MITLTPVTAADLGHLTPYVSPADLAAIEGRLAMPGGENVMACEAHALLAAGGVQLVHRGVGEVWLVVTPRARSRSLSLGRAMRRWLETAIGAHDLHRVQALVRPEVVDALRLILHLGLHYESTMSQICPDRRDAQMFAWIRPKGGVND